MPVTLACDRCGDTYSLPPSKAERSKFCSADCMYAAHVERVELTCEQCGDSFSLRPCEAEGRKYCSRECRDDARRRWVELTCEWCGRRREYKRYRVKEFSHCSEACKMDAARASRWGHGTPVEQVREAVEQADGTPTREQIREAVPCAVPRAIDHAIEELDIGIASAPETRVVEALRADGPMHALELQDAANVGSVAVRRLVDAHVVVHLGEAVGGYHLVESLPPALQPMNWEPPEWAEPAAAAKAEGD